MAAIAAMGISNIAMIGGTVLSAVGAIQQGNAANAAAKYEAAQLESAGKAEQAAASVEAKRANTEKELLLSRTRAVGSTSGGGQDIPLLGRIAEEGDERVLMEVWGGDERAKGRRGQAAARRFEGKQAKRAGYIGAATTALSDGASFFEEYG